MPNLARLATGGGHATLVPSFPAVTCPVQANMTTGKPPREHGVVANGFYWRDQRRVEMWTVWNDCIQRPQIWDMLHDRDRSITSAVWFPLHSKGCGADYICTPAPVHNADGSESLWCFTRPETLYDELQGQARRTFRCTIFGDRWPAFNRRPGSSTSAVYAARTIQAELLLHLPAAPGLRGPKERARTARRPSRPSPSSTPRSASSSPASKRPTRSRRCGWWPANTPSCRSTTCSIRIACCAKPDCSKSAKPTTASTSTSPPARPGHWPIISFRTCSCRTADPKTIKRVAPAVRQAAGHRRSAHRRRRWPNTASTIRAAATSCSSPSRTAGRRTTGGTTTPKRPQFARTVDIHRKPGYDPVELFFDGRTKSIPLNAKLVKGSHGAPARSAAQRGVLLSSEPGVFLGGIVPDVDIAEIVLRQFALD